MRESEMGARHLLSLSFSPPALSLLLLLLFSVAQCGWGMKVGFLQNFRVTWSDSHVKQLENGSSIQLSLDQSSGSGFASKDQYMFGRVSMRIKLIPGDSAGTVTAFYMISEKFDTRDELDFEFLGNRTGQPITVQTNVYASGVGNREQRVNLWFDPSLDFHNYTIFWNHAHSIFFVDDVPIRVYKNNMDRGVPYLNSQPMRVVSTLWNADNWATRGGIEKIDWSNAPFHTYYRDFDIEGCVVPGPAECANNPKNWWDEPTYLRLSPMQARKYRWVRMNYMIYDYCTDKSRNPVPPPECTAGV